MKARTSISHPLQIAEVITPASGMIGVTFCPGKTDPHAMTGAWMRDLETDLNAILLWGATALVTLVEQHELNLLKVADIGAMSEMLGMSWMHLPIKDVSIPGEDFESKWPTSSQILIDKLRAGENILVHCRGGLGRAGLVAARLLIDMGVEPEEAIKRVRDSRPGAIETRQQERYLQSRR